MSERIFISYKRVDKDRVFAIKDFVEKELGGDGDGKNYCWIDLEGIESDALFGAGDWVCFDLCGALEKWK